MMQELRGWARDLSVKHRGMDEYELEDSFAKEGYKLGIEREGSEIKIWLIRERDKKEVRNGKVYLDINLHSDDAVYEAD